MMEIALIAASVSLLLLAWLLRRETVQRAAAEARAESLQRELEGQRGAQGRMEQAFRALSAEALQQQSQQFLLLAEERLRRAQEGAEGELELQKEAVNQLVLPLRDALSQVDTRLREMELTRATAYEGLSQQVRGLLDAQVALRTETARLATALRTPHVRGRWGEETLRRVVEMAGMSPHVDFVEQPTVVGEEGLLRPDLVVKLAGGRSIVVDAKAPLQAYLDALDAPDAATRKQRLQTHASQVRAHVEKLARKNYWEQFQPSPDFVVLFLGDAFYSAALEADPQLLETAFAQRVILATPATLVALLKTVAYGWRQETLAENARIISALGKDLYKRLADLGAHFASLRKALGLSVESFNKAVGSLESRVLVTARKFRDLEAADGALEEVGTVEAEPRALQAPELVERPEPKAGSG